MTDISVALETTKFLFGICDCTVDSDVGRSDTLLGLGILQACERACVRSRVIPGMD